MPAKSVSERVPQTHVALTRFHNQTGEYLDLGLKTPVTITKHGRPHVTFADAGYFARLEEMARGNVLAAMNLVAVAVENMSDDHFAAIQAALPTADELADDRWDRS
jgi:hypothetical protein